jgi:hypothetical protein
MQKLLVEHEIEVTVWSDNIGCGDDQLNGELGSGTTEYDTIPLVASPPASLTETTTAPVDTVVGVPDTTPSNERLRPDGSVPSEMEK